MAKAAAICAAHHQCTLHGQQPRRPRQLQPKDDEGIGEGLGEVVAKEFEVFRTLFGAQRKKKGGARAFDGILCRAHERFVVTDRT